MPALYLDTLKVSTVEETGENTWAQGGLGNSRLISWDYNKEINVTLEDALCTPASLGLCWGGVLSADWKDAQVQINSDFCACQNPVNRINRMEKARYPRSSINDPTENLVSRHLPQTGNEGSTMDFLNKSEVVDGTEIRGVGSVLGHSYKWRLVVESGVRSVAQVPDRFFDIEGRSYPIKWNSKVSVFNGEAATSSNFKDAIIYKINGGVENVKAHPYIIFDGWMDVHGNAGSDSVSMSLQDYLTRYEGNARTEASNNSGLVKAQNSAGEDITDASNVAHNIPTSDKNEKIKITEGNYLAIVIDNNDNYHAYIGVGTDLNSTTDSTISWYSPEKEIVTSQFKGLDMWLRFEGINAMTYFILTKYNQDILRIAPAYRNLPKTKNESETTLQYVYTKTTSTYEKRTSTREDINAEWGDWSDWSTDTSLQTLEAAQQKVAISPEINEAKTSKTEYRVVPTEEEVKENSQLEILTSFANGVGITYTYNGTTLVRVNTDLTEIKEYDEDSIEMGKFEGRLWAYVNPRTMKPYADDYWFHEGEPYYIKSLTIAPKSKQIKANKIVITPDQWPGMYMMVGETYIRDKETGEDERMQIRIPLCKVKADQTITLEADGEPTTFSLNLEVARPRTGALMEITAYEVAKKLVLGDNGCYYAVDGSSEVVIE